ncbi:hydroxymethylbilane synthase [Alienimonas californiensis]|uniref:Porphobilinogen deaminase n=1 Tax=Alienimonas californiensis TaxID=2527989 RepID=A0A517PA70_9PLAN|nr:hydroxymethylbilane synthase [Alienimonas californiensis]QDT16268.1 Porphobilinogen deaminase [Alienimonas californiensis]
MTDGPASSTEGQTLRIATRDSPLALWQANHVAGLLREAHPGLRVELVEVKTTGDRNRVDPLPTMARALEDGTPGGGANGVGLFTKEVQRAVLDGRADVAVHSLKDLPTGPVPGLTLAAVPKRASRWDALVLPDGAGAGSLDDLPEGATVGTGSPRRRAQLLRLRPDLSFAEARGNVETRLAKLDAGDFHALILAEAGLDRLGLSGRISKRLDTEILPAVGQGALGIECRADDPAVDLLAPLNHLIARAEADAERACLHRLGAGCHAPVGVRGRGENPNAIELTAALLSLDGETCLQANATGPDARAVGVAVAESLLERGGSALL